MRDADLPANDTNHAEPAIRYTLAGGRLGVPTVGSYLRALAETAFWLGAASLPARLLWRIGAHRASTRVQRWWARGVSRVIGMRIDWDGLDQIDPDEAHVVTSLHEGLADALVLLQLSLPLRFVLREEFAEWPLLDGYLRDTEQITIRPEAGTKAYRRIVQAGRRARRKPGHLPTRDHPRNRNGLPSRRVRRCARTRAPDPSHRPYRQSPSVGVSVQSSPPPG
jgi:hypothetical protein